MDEEFKSHAFEYLHDGATWCFEVQATSKADAEQRVQRMQHATYLGEVQCRIPSMRVSGMLARTICGVRNLLGPR
jgi:hypothetical protein